MSLRTITVIVLATVALPATVQALPSDAYGTWSTKKGKCKDAELLFRITDKSFNRYEESCKIVKDQVHDPMGLGSTTRKVSLSCDAEGEKVAETVYVEAPETKNQIKIQYESESGHRWLYRCPAK